MLKSKRFWYAVMGIATFLFVALQYAKAGVAVDFLSLGVGIGVALSPAAAATAVGHLASKTK